MLLFKSDENLHKYTHMHQDTPHYPTKKEYQSDKNQQADIRVLNFKALFLGMIEIGISSFCSLYRKLSILDNRGKILEGASS
jgi:hypothetical protein